MARRGWALLPRARHHQPRGAFRDRPDAPDPRPRDAALTLDNVQWQQRSLRVTGQAGPHGSRRKQGIVPLSPRVRALLEPYFALNDTWFVGTRQSQKIVKRVANRAQLAREVTPHVLRHTWAALALQKGISLAAVQKILDHDRLTTTAIYLNLTDGHILEEFEAKW
jgi:integrase/recombinase XerD